MTEVVYVIQNPPDLYKLFVRFSQPKSFNIFRIFDEYERLHESRTQSLRYFCTKERRLCTGFGKYFILWDIVDPRTESNPNPEPNLHTYIHTYIHTILLVIPKGFS